MFGCKALKITETVSQPSTPYTPVSNPEGSIDLSLIILLTAGLLLAARWVWKGNNNG